ncbi:hypothetical protein H2201_001977 [Coniosporium apollinis]|uniref:Tho complex subunit 7 n=1 Tax=Coniosporium apollinis TaxID=61459 RepID=A0ABQ9P391_9PEZI|nr:hypothetical protein H2201_001977 [Coniosporium apollinis]
MATYEYGLLDQADEDSLHTLRLLNVEEKPFKRITKRLLTPASLISTPPTSLPTPPPDISAADEEAAAVDASRRKQAEERRQWREDMVLDFAAFEGSIVRMQLLRTSNEKERERYASEKIKISETAQAIRDNTAELRVQLEEAQKTLALRKTYDELAEKITSNRMLKSRDEQHVQLEKLNTEIAELESESAHYAQTWAERREQFGRIVEEGRQMLRLIRDEKEEAERKEGMEGGEDAEEGEGSTTRGEASVVGTPRPEIDGATPLHASQDAEAPGGARHVSARHRLAPLSSPARSGSRAASPPPQPSSGAEADNQDADMADSGAVATPDKRREDRSDIEEGEEAEDTPAEERMDVT